MTRIEFLELCENKNIATNLIHFENSVTDGYYVLKNYHRWEVFYRERGKDYDCVGCISQLAEIAYMILNSGDDVPVKTIEGQDDNGKNNN